MCWVVEQYISFVRFHCYILHYLMTYTFMLCPSPPPGAPRIDVKVSCYVDDEKEIAEGDMVAIKIELTRLHVPEGGKAKPVYSPRFVCLFVCCWISLGSLYFPDNYCCWCVGSSRTTS